MNKDKYSPIERLFVYYSYSSARGAISMSMISSYESIPLIVIREDFFILLNSLNIDLQVASNKITEKTKQELEYYLKVNSKRYDYSSFNSFIEEVLEDDPDFLLSLYKSGILDDIEFTLSMYTYDDYSSYSYAYIKTSVNEFLAYTHLFELKNKSKKISDEITPLTSSIRYKRYFKEFDNRILSILNDIEDCIQDDSCITFTYRHPDDREIMVTIKPLKIGFDATENTYAVISTTAKQILCYNLEYISNIKRAKSMYVNTNPQLLEKADKVWGFEFNKCIDEDGNIVKPEIVEVIFYNEANVINKAKRNLTYRNPLKLSLNNDGNLIYIDEVYGIDSFLSWIYSFGSSAEIISPKHLKNRIIAELEERI